MALDKGSKRRLGQELEGCSGWQYYLNERSMGVYGVCGWHAYGPEFEFVGVDPDELMSRARGEAARIGDEIARLISEDPKRLRRRGGAGD